MESEEEQDCNGGLGGGRLRAWRLAGVGEEEGVGALTFVESVLKRGRSSFNKEIVRPAESVICIFLPDGPLVAAPACTVASRAQ